MAFLRGLGYDVLQIGGMDYIAQHPSSNRYLMLSNQNNGIISYQVQYKNII